MTGFSPGPPRRIVTRAVSQSLTDDGKLKRDGKKVKGTAVAPSEPREKAGLYWGYSVRLAQSISEVFTQSPYEVRRFKHAQRRSRCVELLWLCPVPMTPGRV